MTPQRLLRRAFNRQPTTRVMYVGLTLASFFLSLTLIAYILVFAGYTGATSRDAARTPTADGAPASFLHEWFPVFDRDGSFDLLAVEPLSPAAPIPPGLSQMPATGELVASPALHSQGGSAIAKQYGLALSDKVIDIGGLTDPKERIGYARFAAGKLSPEAAYSGYGQRFHVGQSSFGSALRAMPMSSMLIAMVPLLVLPAFVLIITATVVGRRHRMARFALAAEAGGNRRFRLRVMTAAISPSLAIATALGLIVVLAIYWRGIWIPVADYTIASGDFRRYLVVAILAPFFASFVAAVVTLSLHLRIPHQIPQSPSRASAIKSALTRTIEGSILATFPLIVTAIWWLYAPLVDLIGENVSLLLLAGMVALVLILFPFFVEEAWRYLGNAIAAWGRRSGSGAQMIIGTLAHTQRSHLARQAVAISLVTITVTLAFVFATLPGQQARHGKDLEVRFGNTFYPVTHADDPEIRRVLATAGDLVSVSTQKVNEDEFRTVLRANCATLETLNFPCEPAGPLIPSDARIAQILAFRGDRSLWLEPAVDPFEAQPDGSGSTEAYILSHQGDTIALEALNARLNSIAPGTGLSSPGASWIAAAQDQVSQLRWLPTIGILTALAATLGIMLVSAADYSALRNTVALLIQTTGDRSLAWKTAAGRILLPFIFHLFLSLLVARVIAATLVNPRFGATIPVGSIIVLVLATIAIGVGVTCVVAAATTRDSARRLA